MQKLKLKYLGTEIEPEPEPVEESAEKTASEIAAQWRDGGGSQEEDVIPDEARELILDESEVQDLNTQSEDF